MNLKAAIKFLLDCLAVVGLSLFITIIHLLFFMCLGSLMPGVLDKGSAEFSKLIDTHKLSGLPWQPRLGFGYVDSWSYEQHVYVRRSKVAAKWRLLTPAVFLQDYCLSLCCGREHPCRRMSTKILMPGGKVVDANKLSCCAKVLNLPIVLVVVVLCWVQFLISAIFRSMAAASLCLPLFVSMVVSGCKPLNDEKDFLNPNVKRCYGGLTYLGAFSFAGLNGFSLMLGFRWWITPLLDNQHTILAFHVGFIATTLLTLFVTFKNLSATNKLGERLLAMRDFKQGQAQSLQEIAKSAEYITSRTLLMGTLTPGLFAGGAFGATTVMGIGEQLCLIPGNLVSGAMAWTLERVIGEKNDDLHLQILLESNDRDPVASKPVGCHVEPIQLSHHLSVLAV